MRIIFASGTFFPESSGQSNFVYNLIKHADLPEKAVVVAYGRQSENREEDIGKNKVRVIIVKRDFWRYWNYYRELKKCRKEADMIYAQDLVSSGLPAAMAKNRKVKLAVRIGGDFLWEKMVNAKRTEVPLSRYYGMPKTLLEKIFLAIYRFVLSRCDLLVFNTQWQLDIYKDNFRLKDKKIEVIPNPLITADSAGDPAVKNDEIIFAGRFIPLKNLVRLVEAFKGAKTEKRLVLIGSGPLKAELESIADKHGRIDIVDSMPQQDLWRRVASCHLMVVPSVSEVNPNVALEALSLKKPVILTEENGLSGDLKRYFKLIDPFSSAGLKEAIEYFEDETNYQDQLKLISQADLKYGWNEVVAQHRAAGIL